MYRLQKEGRNTDYLSRCELPDAVRITEIKIINTVLPRFAKKERHKECRFGTLFHYACAVSYRLIWGKSEKHLYKGG